MNNKIKDILIIFLCILTMYQTVELWFEDISGRNFFYTYFVAQNRIKLNLEEFDFTTPQNIIVGFGNNNFNKFYINKENKFIDNSIENAIKHIVTNSEYMDITQINWNEILASKLVICNYANNIPMDSYIKAMGAKSPQFFSSKQKVFDTLVIVPAKSSGENLKAYFIDTFNDKVAVFYYKKNSYSDDLYSNIEEIQKESNNISYVSTYQSGFEQFKHNIFLPQITDRNVSYLPIKLNIPQQVTLQEIEKKYIDNFFENPAAKWSKVDINGEYMYCDENIVMRYYPSGILEYADYSVNNDNIDNSLMTVFNLVNEIMRKDVSIYENIYLETITNENNVWKLGFNYHFDNFPIIFSKEMKEELNMNNIIEVTVKNNKVISYKHYILNIDYGNYSPLTIDFSTALNNIITENETSTTDNIDDMYLAYSINKNDKYSYLTWIVNTPNYNSETR